MWELGHKVGWVPKNRSFQSVILEKTLESPRDCKQITPDNPKGINLEYSFEGLFLKLKLQYFDHLKWRASSLEKTLILEMNEGKRWERQRMRLVSITDSVDKYLSKLQEDNGSQRSLVCCRITKSRTQLNKWTTVITIYLPVLSQGLFNTKCHLSNIQLCVRLLLIFCHFILFSPQRFCITCYYFFNSYFPFSIWDSELIIGNLGIIFKLIF